MSELPDCLYCRQDQRLHDLMIEIAPLSASTLYLFQRTVSSRPLRGRV